MAGPGGFEPPNAGIKTRCLNRLATAQHWCAKLQKQIVRYYSRKVLTREIIKWRCISGFDNIACQITGEFVA